MDDQIESCDQETIAIKDKIATLNEWQNVKIHDDYNKIQKCSAAHEFTKELADMVIDQVYFYDKNHIEIRWKFTERFLEMIGWGRMLHKNERVIEVRKRSETIRPFLVGWGTKSPSVRG